MLSGQPRAQNLIQRLVPRLEALALEYTAGADNGPLVTTNNAINVFVSYSHADASLVTPVVRLLRVNKSLVFQDADGIEAGKRWRDQIAKALSQSNLVVLFWCHHAFRSTEVSSEWRQALEQGKDVLPLLLDETPLPVELGEFQWIDFRETVGSNHGGTQESISPVVQPDPQASSAKATESRSAGNALPRTSRRGRVSAVIAALVLAAALLLLVFMQFSGSGAFDAARYGIWIALLIGSGVALGALVLWWIRRQDKKPHKPWVRSVELPEQGTSWPPEPIRRVHLPSDFNFDFGRVEKNIATRLEAEILRRTESTPGGKQ